MSLTEKLKLIGEEIKNDPGVRGGVVQVLANITRIVIRGLTHEPKLRAVPESKELQRK
jgi:hypothetical protein